MAIDKTTLKNWFKTGLKPTQPQFWAWMDSYWHKDEKITISSIDGLGDAIDGKAYANHSHSEYATNDATSLSTQDIISWQQTLGIDNLEMSDISIATTIAYERFGLPIGSTIRDFNNKVFDELEFKLTKPTENATADYVLLGDGTTAAKSEFGKVDTVMGIVANPTTKNVDISGVAMNWTNPSQRFSGLADKSADATFNQFPVFDSNGNLAKADNAINALINCALKANQNQKNIFLSYLNGSNFSGTIQITSFGNPFIFKNTGLQQLNVIGLNIFLDIDSSSVFIIKSGTTTEIPVNFTNVNTTTLAIQLDTDNLQEGEYYVRIRGNFQNHTSVRLFRLLDIQNAESIDMSMQPNTIIYNSNLTGITNEYSVSGGSITANSYNTSIAENTPFGSITIELGGLTFNDDFIISGTYNSTGGNGLGSTNTHTFGLSTGVGTSLVNPILYGFTNRNYQTKQSVILVGASGETAPLNSTQVSAYSFSWVIAKTEGMITLNIINPSTGVSVFNATSIINNGGIVTFSFFGNRNQGNWIPSINISSVIKIN